MSLKGTKQSFNILRGEGEEAQLEAYELELDEGMVVLDCVHRIQHEQEPDMAVRWNCKAGKCGSCSAEINGRPRLMCMTRMSDVVAETPAGQPIEIRPMKTFPSRQGPCNRCELELRRRSANQTHQRTGQHGLGVQSNGSRPGPTFPRMHRMLPLRQHLPCTA